MTVYISRISRDLMESQLTNHSSEIMNHFGGTHILIRTLLIHLFNKPQNQKHVKMQHTSFSINYTLPLNYS